MIFDNIDGNILYNGDCLEIMDEMIKGREKIDKVITSPPYNIIRPNSSDRGYDEYKDGMSNDEYIDWTLEIFNKYDKLLNENGCIIYNMSYGTENTELMNLVVADIIRKTNFTIADIIVWKKKSATPNNVSSNKMTRIVEFVYVFCRKDEFNTFSSNKKVLSERKSGQKVYENVYNYFSSSNNDYSNELNKATFSTDFVQQIIDRYVTKNDIVLDNFSGTGTTMSCCISNGIKCVGIELSKKQCEHTVERISKGTQLNIFGISKGDNVK